MSEEIKIYFDEDGIAKEYDDTYDITIHCESEEEQNELLDRLNRQWISVSERLPEDHKDVLICLSSDEICIGCYNSHRLPFRNNVIGWGASYVHNWCSNDVIAWMPLPEPYKASPTGEEVD